MSRLLRAVEGPLRVVSFERDYLEKYERSGARMTESLASQGNAMHVKHEEP